MNITIKHTLTNIQKFNSKIVLVLVACFSIAFSLHAKVIHVPSDFTSIQSAIDTADNGDSIVVAPGVYNENIKVMHKYNISIIGLDADVTTIMGLGTFHVVSFNVASGEISGFTIKNSGNTMGYHSGVFTSQATVTIKNNIITENNQAMSLSSLSSIIVERNKIFNNYAWHIIESQGSTDGIIQNNLIVEDDISWAIYANNSNIDIVNNTLIGNGGRGIYLNPSDTQYVCNNIIVNYEYAISFNDSLIVQRFNNNLWNNTINYQAFWGSSQYSQNDIYTQPMFIDTLTMNYQLMPSSPCINAGYPDISIFQLSPIDLAGSPRVYGSFIDIGAYEFQGNVGVELPLNARNIEIYPNPFSESTTIKFTPFEETNREMFVYDSMGNLVYRKRINNENHLKFNKGGLSSGIYYLFIKSEKEMHSQGKLVII